MCRVRYACCTFAALCCTRGLWAWVGASVVGDKRVHLGMVSGLLSSRPTPIMQLAKSVRQAGRLSWRVARNVQPTCPLHLLPRAARGWCQWVSRLP